MNILNNIPRTDLPKHSFNRSLIKSVFRIPHLNRPTFLGMASNLNFSSLIAKPLQVNKLNNLSRSIEVLYKHQNTVSIDRLQILIEQFDLLI